MTPRKCCKVFNFTFAPFTFLVFLFSADCFSCLDVNFDAKHTMILLFLFSMLSLARGALFQHVPFILLLNTSCYCHPEHLINSEILSFQHGHLQKCCKVCKTSFPFLVVFCCTFAFIAIYTVILLFLVCV